MKRTPLVIAAVIPLVAFAAAEEVDQQTLKNHLQATSMLGAEVQANDGAGLGTLEDIVFDRRQGNIRNLLIQRNGEIPAAAGEAADSAERGVEQGWEATENALDSGAQEAEEGWSEATGGAGDELDEDGADIADARSQRRERPEFEEADSDEGMDMSADPDRADTTEAGDAFTSLRWSDVSYDAEQQVLRVNANTASMEDVEYEQDSSMAADEVRASKLVGLEVNLVDEDSFGEVEDVMIDPRKGAASAIVVDSMAFFDKQRYALPVDLRTINDEEESLNVNMTQQQVKEMGEFEMEDDLSIR